MLGAYGNGSLCVVNETNSWPVYLDLDNVTWSCEYESLPQYVKTWLDQSALYFSVVNPARGRESRDENFSKKVAEAVRRIKENK